MKSLLYVGNAVIKSLSLLLLLLFAPGKFDVLKTNICPRSEIC